jgi:carboxypeptidase family protein
MFTRSIIIAALAVALVAGGSAFAADNKSSHGAIRGTLTGEDGKPYGGAEIRALRVDAKQSVAIATTDSHGVYLFKGLPVGAYSITAVVDSAAVSRANVKTSDHGWSKVDFDLRLNAKSDPGADRLQRDLRWGPGNLNTRDHSKFGAGG